jgi:thiamine pyrophosphate-dependent acetolactate synthase large subunit-like protein
MFLKAVAGPIAKLVEGPARFRHANHRHVKVASLQHRLERRKNLLVGQVSSAPKKTRASDWASLITASSYDPSLAGLFRIVPADGIPALDNGMYKIWFARNYRTRMANIILLDNALATMGAALPSAMMAALLYPESRVMAVCGDGGFMMNSQELETAVRLKLNLVILLIEDHAFGMAPNLLPAWFNSYIGPNN